MGKNRDVPTTHCTCTFNTHGRVTLAPFAGLVQSSAGNSFSHVKFHALIIQEASAWMILVADQVQALSGVGTHCCPPAAWVPFLHSCPLAQHLCPVPLATGLPPGELDHTPTQCQSLLPPLLLRPGVGAREHCQDTWPLGPTCLGTVEPPTGRARGTKKEKGLSPCPLSVQKSGPKIQCVPELSHFSSQSQLD